MEFLLIPPFEEHLPVFGYFFEALAQAWLLSVSLRMVVFRATGIRWLVAYRFGLCPAPSKKGRGHLPSQACIHGGGTADLHLYVGLPSEDHLLFRPQFTHRNVGGGSLLLIHPVS